MKDDKKITIFNRMENQKKLDKIKREMDKDKKLSNPKIESLFQQRDINSKIKKIEEITRKKRKEVDLDVAMKNYTIKEKDKNGLKQKEVDKAKENLKRTNSVNSTRGTYVAVDYSPASVKFLDDIIKLLGLKKDFKDSYHTTIAYSTTEFVFYPKTCMSRRKKRKWVPADKKIIKIKSIGHFKTPEGKNLHIELDAPFLESEHKRTLQAGAKYDFDKYIPHITLMYNCGKFDVKDLPQETLDKIIGKPLVMKDEYVEKLNLNWNEDNKN